jgi:hypothetical protein
MRVIADRPGVTVAELASATGIARNVVYSLMRTLTQQGHIERVQLPGESVGFRLVRANERSNGAAGKDIGVTDEAITKPNRTRRSRRSPGQVTAVETNGEPATDPSPALTEPAPA